MTDKIITPYKDWTGNDKSSFCTIGATGHGNNDREQHDYYATPPIAADLLIQNANICGNIWEPACGGGHLSRRFEELGYTVKSTDLIDRGYGTGGVDFLKCTEMFEGNIITNPPYRYALEFCKHALSLVDYGWKVAMFLKLTFLEGKARQKFFHATPPHTLYVMSSRLTCKINGDFETKDNGAVAYGWYVWIKGDTSPTTIKWIN